MDPLLILAAFVCGFLVSRIGLPPLVGYLLAGFLLRGIGVSAGDGLEQLADLGILLLLFSIGLKLKIKSLARKEIWATTLLHMGGTIALFLLFFMLARFSSISVISELEWQQTLLICFGLSFSSTVFAVKTFESRGDMASLHSRIAIGVLIIQDIAAVIFLAVSKGELPSPWAVSLVPILLILRPLLLKLLDHCGHRELLLLFGIFVPIGLGAGIFEYFNLKPDLGALVFGVMLGTSRKSEELAYSILSLKDLLLVGFFLNIGLSGLPTLENLFIATLLVLLLPLKTGGFFALFTSFRLRSRTGLLASLALSNFSEFGLLVCAIGVKSALLESQWLVTMALALSLSFLLAAPFNNKAHGIYERLRDKLHRFERRERLGYDRPIDTGNANVLIFGMGRVGTTLYDRLSSNRELRLAGLDYDEDRVKAHIREGRNVIHDDATDSDLWEKICTHSVSMVILTMASHQANIFTIERLKASGFTGEISATARFPDQLQELLDRGVTQAYDLFGAAGQGFANEVLDHMERLRDPRR